MKAMILAAGRGERMRPLTDTCPKPLLKVNGKALIDYHLESLALCGIHEVVINTAWLGQQVTTHVGNGSRWGLNIQFSHEGWPALETGGGIFNALPLLGNEPFLVINGDVFTSWRLTSPQLPMQWRSESLVHLILVPNPSHHPRGDFGLSDHVLTENASEQFTYSGIGFFHPLLFSGCRGGAFKLAPLLYGAVHKNRATGELFSGNWSDVGTPERLASLQE
ncbi:MAG TPA: nucleotidyltransferase family protein [Steroidobacteraceae bacterium]|nr:nucleotidyltransferase family protein [Steroidobacteraceae bacterium]